MSDIEYIIEPLDTSKHDREAFSCGVDQVDNYLHKTANKLMKDGNTKVHIMREDSSPSSIMGFYAFNAHSVHYKELPKKFERTRPSHGDIPAAFISMIGVDTKYQGQGFGSLLLADALKRTARISEDMGIAVALLDVLDCGDDSLVGKRKTMYEGFGFQSQESNPLRMYLPIKDVLALIAEEE